jgi:hypothetical protein
VKGAPFFEFAVRFRQFLEERDFDGPSEFHRHLRSIMGKDSPSLSEIYMVFYGQRVFRSHILLFMAERYGFKVGWRTTLPVLDVNGNRKKTNQLALPGIRDIRNGK